MNENKDYYNALPTGYRLEQYQIIKVLGAGGFGIAYLATDTRLDTQVVIKEYLPNDLSVREQSSSQILPKDPESRSDYESGLKEYIKEARTIAKFDHPNIVQVKNYMEANNTAYIVMSYVQGSSLSELAKGETATEEEIRRILFPLLDGLKEVHKQGYLHRDIKPSNIFIQEQTRRPVLIDFGAARFHLGVRSKSMTSVVTAGYSPYEQYHTGGKQGAWTDIYAMGGVLYRLISGQNPPEAPERITTTMDGEIDPLRPAVDMGKGEYDPALLKAIDYALALRPMDRPQTIDEWLKVLNNKSNQATSKKKIIKKNKTVKSVEEKISLSNTKARISTNIFQKTGDKNKILPTDISNNTEAKKNKKTILLLVPILSLIFILLALSSYYPNDPGLFVHESGDEIKNLLGSVGAYLSDVLIGFMGYFSFSIPLIGFYIIIKSYAKKNSKIKPLAIFNTFIFLLSGCGLITLLVPESDLIYKSGGLVGIAIAKFLVFSIGHFFSALLLLFLVFITATLVIWSIVSLFKNNKINYISYLFIVLAILAGLLFFQKNKWGQVLQLPLQTDIKKSLIPSPQQSIFEPEMQFIKGGNFQMGSPSSEKGRYDNEKLHIVRVKDFLMSTTEITFDQWQLCVDNGGCQSNKMPNDSGWGRGNRPVINVNWYDAMEYTVWLSRETGKNYRLPTEAEWEYSARANSINRFYFGNDEIQLCANGNHADKSITAVWKNKTCTDGVGEKTAEVGKYIANDYGLHDMMGNVYEWICSSYQRDYNGSENKCVNGNSIDLLVLRGGSWKNLPRNIRLANRYFKPASFRSNTVGFRVAKIN